MRHSSLFYTYRLTPVRTASWCLTSPTNLTVMTKTSAATSSSFSTGWSIYFSLQSYGTVRVWVMHAFALVYHSPTNPPPPAIEFRFVTTSSSSTTTMIRLRTKTANSRIEWCHRRLPSAKPACVWRPGASASGSGEVRSENITRHRGAVAVSKFGTPRCRAVFSRVHLPGQVPTLRKSVICHQQMSSMGVFQNQLYFWAVGSSLHENSALWLYVTNATVWWSGVGIQ